MADAPPRQAGSRPFPNSPVLTVNTEMPFEHLVVVMMENHSFDNLLGALSETRADVDGLTFNNGKATNSNPGGPKTPATVTAFGLPNTEQGSEVNQTWKESHAQIAGGAMDGFVKSTDSEQPMGYYTPELLPFAYSLASTFTVGDRWFCSLPGPTYPNRRFLLAATAYGCTITDGDSLLDPEPPQGTVFDLLSDHDIDWSNYFSDLPMSMVIARNAIKHFDHHHPIDKFYADCAAGTLPAVSFVDPRIGVLSRIGAPIAQLPSPFNEALKGIGATLTASDPGQTQEDPQDMRFGEAWAYKIVNAVLDSPRWPQTCLIYIYDEHGGYYDHVPPPTVIAPDNIKPILLPTDPVAGYTQYGPRVPAVVVSPYSKPGGVTHIIHDHTSVLATIEHKWNLPALTLRDANAATIMDFLDPQSTALLHPPKLTAPPTPPTAVNGAA
jgi:phospholipase C